MQPPRQFSDTRIANIDYSLDTHKHYSSAQHNEGSGKEAIPGLHRPAIGMIVSSSHVQKAKAQHRQNDREPKHQMRQEHGQEEPVLVGLPIDQPKYPNTHEIHRVDHQNCKEPEAHP